MMNSDKLYLQAVQEVTRVAESWRQIINARNELHSMLHNFEKHFDDTEIISLQAGMTKIPIAKEGWEILHNNGYTNIDLVVWLLPDLIDKLVGGLKGKNLYGWLPVAHEMVDTQQVEQNIIAYCEDENNKVENLRDFSTMMDLFGAHSGDKVMSMVDNMLNAERVLEEGIEQHSDFLRLDKRAPEAKSYLDEAREQAKIIASNATVIQEALGEMTAHNLVDEIFAHCA